MCDLSYGFFVLNAHCKFSKINRFIFVLTLHFKTYSSPFMKKFILFQQQFSSESLKFILLHLLIAVCLWLFNSNLKLKMFLKSMLGMRKSISMSHTQHHIHHPPTTIIRKMYVSVPNSCAMLCFCMLFYMLFCTNMNQSAAAFRSSASEKMENKECLL